MLSSDMPNKKIITLIALGFFAFISLLYGITAPTKWKAAAGSRMAGPEAASPLKGIAPVKRRAVRSKFAAWKRKPFVQKTTEAPVQLVLQGIVGSPSAPKAMIGDSIVGVGGMVGNNRVVAIKKDSVVLNDGTKDFELFIKQ